MQQPVYATIGSGIVNTAFTVVSVSLLHHCPQASRQLGSSLGPQGLMTKQQPLL